MRFSRNWIAEHVDLPESTSALAARLSMLGHVVDDARKSGDDLVLDLDLASNRPDVMNHVGIATEIAVAAEGSARVPEPDLVEGEIDAQSLLDVRIDDPEGCRRFVSRVLVDVEVGPSPEWLCRRLESIGLRPINNVVDVTNFVMWELGRPLHAYDLDKVAGAVLQVRHARAGETVVTLDDQRRRLLPDDLVIADAESVIGLAGLMGGASTGVEVGASRVALECACFDRRQVRSMARRFGLHTDAGHRFERGLSNEGIRQAIDRAAELVAELCGATVAHGVIDVVAQADEPWTVLLRAEKLERMLGVRVPADRVEAILGALGFRLEGQNGDWLVRVPPRRQDVRREVDLVEEVARFHGYDRLPTTLPLLRRSEPRGRTTELRAEARVRELCSGLGYWEAMTLSLTCSAEQAAFVGPESTLIDLGNPLSETLAALQASVLPGLTASLARNLNHGAAAVRLFELARCFRPTADSSPPVERRHLGLVAAGPAVPAHWSRLEQGYDHAELRGAVDTLAERMRWPAPEWAPGSAPGFLDGATARVDLGDLGCGYAGSLDPAALEQLGIDTAVWAVELDIEGLLALARPIHRATALPRFPASERDVSLLVADTTDYAGARAALRGLQDVPLADLELVEIYRGEDLPDGHLAWTLRMTYRAVDRTLTSDEIQAGHDAVVERLLERLPAERR